VIRGIIFDCFGVLYQGSLGYLRELTPPEHMQELNDLSHASDYGYITHDDYFTQVGAIIGRPPKEVAKIIAAKHVRNEEMFMYVRELREQYKTAFLSNVGRGVVQELFTSAELSELFDVETLSSEVSMVKPNPEIYEYTAAQLGLASYECVMIDDIAENIIGARSTGMQGIVYKDITHCKQELTKLLDQNNA
jgi:putative hydrolase of the HAD superfamily